MRAAWFVCNFKLQIESIDWNGSERASREEKKTHRNKWNTIYFEQWKIKITMWEQCRALNNPPSNSNRISFFLLQCSLLGNRGIFFFQWRTRLYPPFSFETRLNILFFSFSGKIAAFFNAFKHLKVLCSYLSSICYQPKTRKKMELNRFHF